MAVAAVDRVIWPVDARRGMFERAALLLRTTAALYREADPLGAHARPANYEAAAGVRISPPWYTSAVIQLPGMPEILTVTRRHRPPSLPTA